MIAQLLLLALAAAGPAPAGEPATLALVVASNRGARPGRPALQYADDDGAKYHHVLAAVAGEANVVLLTEFDRDTARLFPELVGKVGQPTREAVKAAGEALGRRAARLREAGRAVRFFFVFAGHGDVEDGKGFIELSDGPFTADDLEALLAGVAASETHVILDSCNSFFLVSPRRPGGTRVATPQDAAEQLARRLPDVGVFLSTSSQAEVFEWSELQSGVFSHAVRSGLLGAADADGDGRVSYRELAAFVETATGAIKNPLYRPRLFARGPNGDQARTVLERPAGARALLRIDEAAPTRLAVRDADGLRWLDTFQEGGAAATAWFPPGRPGALEVERLRPAPDGGMERLSTSRLDPLEEPGPPVLLADLALRPVSVAERGAGEVFRTLFTRPYGPQAYQAFLAEGGVERVADCPPEPEVSASGWRWWPHLSGWVGAAQTTLRIAGAAVDAPPMGAGPGVGLSVPLLTSGALDVGLEAAYLSARSTGTWQSAALWDALAGPGYLDGRTPPSAKLAVTSVPLLATGRVTLGHAWNGVSRLTLGLGALFTSLEARPVNVFTGSVWRAHGWAPVATFGLGFSRVFSGRFAAGMEFKVLAPFAPLHATDRDIASTSLILAATLDWGSTPLER